MPITLWVKKWLIWSHERRQWWTPSRQGYTFYRNEAGRYSYLDACEICKEANQYCSDSPHESMLEADSMLAATDLIIATLPRTSTPP
jgi:hypothetical protein